MIIFLLAGLAGCSNAPPATEAESSTSSIVSQAQQASGPHLLTSQHLPNPVQIHPKVISGGLPEGAAAFAELKSLGIKTILSVDGMKPDVDLARKYGLRYVHLPHGYDGIPEQRVKELAKAVRELEGPIYIHCHHGKHRSPAAASVACVTAGFIPLEQGLEVLRIAGTNPNYRGLYESVQAAHPADLALLEQLEVEFAETVPVPPMAEAMVAIGHAYEHLKLIEKAGWNVPPSHPDLVPAHEALMLREHYTEMLRTEEVIHQPVDFRQMVALSEQAAQGLEDQLLQKATAAESNVVPEMLSQKLDVISQNCKRCHQEYRDVPLSAKQAMD